MLEILEVEQTRRTLKVWDAEVPTVGRSAGDDFLKERKKG